MVFISRSALALSALFLSVNAQTLSSVIEATPELSTLGAIAAAFPAVVGNLTSRPGTLLAPNNDAFAAYLAAAGPNVGLGDLSAEFVTDLLSYHYIPVPLKSEDLVAPGGAVAPTALTSGALANLGGDPQSVFASAYGSTGLAPTAGGLRIYTGAGNPANVTTADVELEDGTVVHIISSVLNLPLTPSKTAEAAGLTTLIRALEITDLVETVDTTAKLTVFAPTDKAFADAGVDFSKISAEDLAKVLTYHVVGAVGFSSAIEDGTKLETLAGQELTIRKRDGKLWVNDVEVIQANVVTTNGVAHVLGGVLTPPAAGSPAPAPPAASSTGSGSNSGSNTDGDDADDSEDGHAARTAVPAVAAIFAFAATYLLL